jgi:Lysozyme like domain
MSNPAQLVQLGQSVGLPLQQAKLMAAIGMAESGGNPIAHNLNSDTGDNSYGFWQVNMNGPLGPARRKEFGLQNNEQLYDPTTNAMAMKRILQSSGPSAWTTYTSGQYKQFLPIVEKAVAGGVPTGPIPQAGFDSSQLPQQVTPQDFVQAFTKQIITNALTGPSPFTPWTTPDKQDTQIPDYFGSSSNVDDASFGIRPLYTAGL